MKVHYIDHMGSDLSVVNAARVSFGKRSKQLTEKDKGLIRFLARGCTKGDWDKLIEDKLMWNWLDEMDAPDEEELHRTLQHIKNMPTHWTPFGHTAITLHIKAPIFVARQLGKHQVGMVWNEVSRRYVTEEPEFYIPEVWRKAADNVKQGSSDVRMEIDRAFRKLNGQTKNSRRSPCTVKFANWKARAKREGAEFSLDIDDVPWETRCPIMGMPLDYTLCDGKGAKPDSPTLDRIDSNKGYVKGNVQVLSWLANTMKSCASQDELMTFIKGAALRHGGGRVETVGDYNQRCVDLYNAILEEGGCAEQARMVLPQSMYTEWYWTGNLYSFANVFIQRSDSHAQKEVQKIAEQIDYLLMPLFPVSWPALTRGA